jgi:hypothetical protein
VADHVGCRTRREQVSRVSSATGIIAKSKVGRRWLGCGWQARRERLCDRIAARSVEHRELHPDKIIITTYHPRL